MADATADDQRLIARAFHVVLGWFVRTGRAPHYTELATELGLEPEAARALQAELLAAHGAAWALPGTDYVASFAPFSNIPTQYLVSVDGEQRWYAQCGLEVLALTWVFPGREVRVDARCLDCAEPLVVRMRDGAIVEATPDTIVGHTNLPPAQWAANITSA